MSLLRRRLVRDTHSHLEATVVLSGLSLTVSFLDLFLGFLCVCLYFYHIQLLASTSCQLGSVLFSTMPFAPQSNPVKEDLLAETVLEASL